MSEPLDLDEMEREIRAGDHPDPDPIYEDALRLIAELREARETIEEQRYYFSQLIEARKEVEVPNIWLCETCGLVANIQGIDMASGRVGTPAVQEIPDCPNECGVKMRRQTWRENAQGQADGAEILARERNEARKDTERLDWLYKMLYRVGNRVARLRIGSNAVLYLEGDVSTWTKVIIPLGTGIEDSREAIDAAKGTN